MAFVQNGMKQVKKISEIRFDNGVPVQDLLTGQRISADEVEDRIDQVDNASKTVTESDSNALKLLLQEMKTIAKKSQRSLTKFQKKNQPQIKMLQKLSLQKV